MGDWPFGTGAQEAQPGGGRRMYRTQESCRTSPPPPQFQANGARRLLVRLGGWEPSRVLGFTSESRCRTWGPVLPLLVVRIDRIQPPPMLARRIAPLDSPPPTTTATAPTRCVYGNAHRSFSRKSRTNVVLASLSARRNAAGDGARGRTMVSPDSRNSSCVNPTKSSRNCVELGGSIIGNATILGGRPLC